MEKSRVSGVAEIGKVGEWPRVIFHWVGYEQTGE